MDIDDVMPKILLLGWRDWSGGIPGQRRYYRDFDGLKVIASLEKYDDNREWLHVSISHANRLPSWAELREVKNIFIGKEKVAIQVLPRESEYVNFHPFVLHLWHCLSSPELIPDFSRGSGMI